MEAGDEMKVWIANIFSVIFCKEIVIELVKIAFTALIGFFTFNIYQMYRNKKDNSKLYIQMIKLEREISNNVQALATIIDDHSQYYLLDSLFRNVKAEGIYGLYEIVDHLSQYIYCEVIYEKGEPVDAEYVYSEKPYEIINSLNYKRQEVESEGESYPGELDDINEEINKCNEKTIFDIFSEIEKSIEKIDVHNHKMSSPINYLREKIVAYNSNDLKYKKKKINAFCSQLLDGNNIFSESLELFKEYKNLSKKIHRGGLYEEELIKIEFTVWKNQDMDLLGVYSSDDYLFLEEFYHKNNIIELGNWELDKAEELRKEFQNVNDGRVKKIKNRLKKTLNKTNRYFKKI